MKKSIINKALRIAALALCIAAALAFCACRTEYKGFDDSGMPKSAEDEAVLARWDEYDILKPVPRYTGGGVFEVIANPSGEAVNVYYNGTTQEDFIAYNSKLSEAGFRLAPDSKIWTAEGTLGVPQYSKDDRMVTLVWSADGSLAICVAYK